MGPVFPDSPFTRQAFRCYKTHVLFIKTHIKTFLWGFFFPSAPMKSESPRIKIHSYSIPVRSYKVALLFKEMFLYTSLEL